MHLKTFQEAAIRTLLASLLAFYLLAGRILLMGVRMKRNTRAQGHSRNAGTSQGIAQLRAFNLKRGDSKRAEVSIVKIANQVCVQSLMLVKTIEWTRIFCLVGKFSPRVLVTTPCLIKQQV